MPQIVLTDQVFDAARRRAVESGFGTVDEYVADVLTEDASNVDFDPAQLFTPERLAELDAAAADVRAGRVLTREQVDAELATRRAEWLKANGR